MNNLKTYDTMSKDELIEQCFNKDIIIESCVEKMRRNKKELLTKKDIMELYQCESDKALKILKIMFQMGYANKIGKEYYITQDSYREFMKKMTGKEVCI